MNKQFRWLMPVAVFGCLSIAAILALTGVMDSPMKGMPIALFISSGLSLAAVFIRRIRASVKYLWAACVVIGALVFIAALVLELGEVWFQYSVPAVFCGAAFFLLLNLVKSE